MANRSVAGAKKTTNRSVAGTKSSSSSASVKSTGGGSGGKSGGSKKSGSGKSSDKDQQKKTQAQLNNTGANYQKRKDDLDKITQQRKNELEGIAKNRLDDMNSVAQKQLENINQQQKANDAALATNRRNIMQQVEWQPNQQKEQSTMMALRNRMGNSAYGSGIQDLVEGMARVDDMNDVDLINTWKQNENNAYGNWYTANQSLVADYNDQITKTLDEFSQYKSDYADQISKLNNSYQDELSQLYSQYWSTMSNVNPELATKSNLQSAAKNATGKSKTAKAVTSAKNVQKAVKATKGGTANKKTTAKATKGLTKSEKKAYNSIVKAANSKSNKGNAKAVQTAANKAAKQAVSDAKAKNSVSVGKGEEQYTLPNVNLAGTANLASSLNIAPSAALQKMLVAKQNADSQSALTRNMLRGNKSSGDVMLGGANGSIGTSRAANSGFSDNLAAFRRV